jgi:hypothetical protein
VEFRRYKRSQEAIKNSKQEGNTKSQAIGFIQYADKDCEMDTLAVLPS